MRKHALKLVSLLSVALAMALFVPLRAAADDDDPPTRVARLSYTHGAVSFQPAGTDDWVSGIVNRPMTTGDKLWSDSGARAELQLGSASIRLSGTTGFSFLNLTDNVIQLRLTEGTIRVCVRRLGDNETFEVDTPNLAFSILRPGTYKINVNQEGDTTVVTVPGGEGEVTGGGQAYTVHAEEVGTFIGTDQLNGDIESYDGDEDDFDHWCSGRERREDHSESARYVSTDAIGYEDLDDNGGWRPVPEYGRVWFPHTTIVGWAPYRYGHWVWISPWGWTWIDDEPWGFAPFHYGRWVTVGGVWGWVPCAPAPVVVGVAYVRPVYAPALVAWVGGEHWDVGIGVGGFAAGVAWFPLGPREVYMPSYPVSRTYVTNVNVTNTTVNNTVVNNYYNNVVVNKNVNVTNVTYVNQSVPGAVTATSHAAFTSAQPVAKNMVKVDTRQIASAPVNVTAPAVAPPKQAVLGAGAAAAAKPPAAVENRAVIAKTTPPPAPQRFEKQQEDIRANGGKPLANSQVRQILPGRAEAAAPVKIAPPAKPATPQNAQAYKPGQPPASAGNRPGTPPSNARPPVQANMPGTTPANNVNLKTYNDRPLSARPSTSANNVNPKTDNDRLPSARPSTSANSVNPQLEQKHQQQVEQLHAKQDQERQKIEQQQIQERQKVQQQQADEQRQQQVNQKHQQQLQQLEQKHDQQQQNLQQKQTQERQKEQKPPPPPPKPAKEDKPPHKP
ncbi:MAG TPA: DUF6600 domain-containing protein [Candidatus Acidoferrum sp.]|nr:DUF6600 domain-containing protein [Candidatus Acidoferrum sp.]